MSKEKELCHKCAEPKANHRPSDGCPYNGWTNYETWAVKLWIDNEELSYRYWREAAQEIYEDPPTNDVWTLDERRRFTLADRLKDEHEQLSETAVDSASVFTDLLNAALSEVNWYEVAESLLEDVREASEVSE